MEDGIIMGKGVDHITTEELTLNLKHLVREWDMHKMRVTDDGEMLAPIEWIPTADQVRELILDTMSEQSESSLEDKLWRFRS